MHVKLINYLSICFLHQSCKFGKVIIDTFRKQKNVLIRQKIAKIMSLQIKICKNK